MLSVWDSTTSKQIRQPLEQNIAADAAVIGGGMCGILTAYRLKEEGLDTVVLEANETGSGQTHLTTAKITAQHGLCYDALIRSAGYAKAKQYADANRIAVRQYANLVESLDIHCRFDKVNSYLYTCCRDPEQPGGGLDALQREKAAALTLGIECSLLTAPNGSTLNPALLSASGADRILQPLEITGALCFPGQAQFHPLAFLYFLAKKLRIYEHTPVTRVQGHNVFTPRGKVSCKYVVFACHYPFPLFPGEYFMKLHQERSYVLQLTNMSQFSDDFAPKGIYYGIDEGGYSLRFMDYSLLFGGQGHRTGKLPQDISKGGYPDCYEHLRRDAHALWPGLTPCRMWSAQDCISLDHIPYIGRYSSGEPDWYVATGFGKWGMTSSMAAASILTDLICGRPSPYAEVFSPQRMLPGSAYPALGEHLKESSAGLWRGALCSLSRSPHFTLDPADRSWITDRLAPGEGGILHRKGHTIGAYMDENSELHLVFPKCPHMGCLLSWNPSDHTWDCPCHGSRFNADGVLLDGPAQTDIPKL
ncbi:MAG: FAD-dependent oxidoreductase [Lachnospiraceae bacterium]|nr:FAD-dependent oxidoreductase [Lachnospiraceae bacterium]